MMAERLFTVKAELLKHNVTVTLTEITEPSLKEAHAQVTRFLVRGGIAPTRMQHQITAQRSAIRIGDEAIIHIRAHPP